MNTLPFLLLAKFTPYHRHDGTSFHDFYDQYLKGFFKVVGIFACFLIVAVIIMMVFSAYGVLKEQSKDQKKERIELKSLAIR